MNWVEPSKREKNSRPMRVILAGSLGAGERKREADPSGFPSGGAGSAQLSTEADVHLHPGRISPHRLSPCYGFRMKRGIGATTTLAATALMLAVSGCAGEAGADPAPTVSSQRAADGASGVSASGDSSETGTGAAPDATGTLVSADGTTTGRVEVVLEDEVGSTGENEPVAHVTFMDLKTPYDRLTTGGALEPRGEDPCFDTGIRSGGGDIVPDRDSAVTSVMPATGEGHTLSEIVLHLSGAQVAEGESTCMQPVIARAALTWAE